MGASAPVSRDLPTLAATASSRRSVAHTHGKRPRQRRATPPTGVPIVAAHPGDHALVHQLLLAVHQAPSRAEFQSSLDYPEYEPTDRLLIKIDSQIVGHVQLIRRTVRFGNVEIPTAAVQWLAVLPEYRAAGYREILMAAAQREARADGAELITSTRGNIAAAGDDGWITLAEPSYTLSSARDTLALISHKPRRKNIHARVWRHVELASLVDIYRQHGVDRHGPVVRSDAYWHWLCSRKAYDQIIVAIEGRDTLDYGANGAKIVGYAVIAREQIVELITLPSHRRCAARMLARACEDAIERNRDTIVLHAPAAHGLHELMVTAGGQWRTDAQPCAEPMLVKVVQPAALVRRLYGRFHAAAKAAELPRPLQLGLAIDGQPHRFTLTRRSARLVSETPERIDLACTSDDFSRLLLGGLDVRRASAAGQIRVSEPSKLERLAVLFPTFPYWQSPLDDLPVR